LRQCRPGEFDLLLEIPKRDAEVDLENDTSDIFWGLYALENPSMRYVVFWMFVFNSWAFVMAFIWLFRLKHSNDLNGALTMLAISLPFTGALFVSIMQQWGIAYSPRSTFSI